MEHIPEQQIDSIVKLFVTWNNHANEQVGRRMVHRFDKWFECLATIHLGENKVKSQVHLRVCEAFGSALKTIQKPKELVPCAYQLFQTELDAFKQEQKTFELDNDPGEMVQQVWSSLSQTHQNLLLQVYANGNTVSQGEFLPLLEARYALKDSLFNKFVKGNTDGVDWVLSPNTPDRDLIPMPLFESGNIDSPIERQYFECWLINAPVICMDIQEFAPFAHALKSGCIVSEVKMVSEPSITKAPLASQDVLSTGKIPETQTPIPEHVKSPEQDNFNSIAKPIVLLLLTAIALIGIWILIRGG